MGQNYSVDVVVPCLNEEEALPQTIASLLACLRDCLDDPDLNMSAFRLLFVDDGSTDDTWAIIARHARDQPEIDGIKLSRNFGHQYALLAGMTHATAEATISIDADLQDDIGVVADMLMAYERGSDLVLGVRSDRDTDTRYKRVTSNIFYRLMRRLGAPTVEQHADFRLMSARARQALLAHEEANLFLRGLVTNLGFPVTLVPYARKAREFGETKYTFRKMWGLAANGVTSFSVTPLRIVTALGGIVFVLSALTGLFVICLRLFAPATVVPGWTSTMLPLLFLGGLQILSIGVLGEYVGRIYMEVKRRPRFIVEATTVATTVATTADNGDREKAG